MKKKIHRGATSPALENLFDVPEESPRLEDAQKKSFHTDVARLLYLAKRARMDILTAVFSCARPNRRRSNKTESCADVFVNN